MPKGVINTWTPPGLAKQKNGFPILGKQDNGTKIVFPVEEINYLIGEQNVPVLWMNCRNTEQAIQYYRKHFPYFTSDVQERLAVDSFRRKVDEEIKQKLSDKGITK